MSRILYTVILLLICGRLSSCEYTVKTFEGFQMMQKAMADKIPLIHELNHKLTSVFKAEQLINLFSDPEELENQLTGNISDNCKISLLYAALHLKENWTINMIDATAKPPPAIQYGALNWVGNFEMCMSNPPPKSYKGVPPRSHYCRIKFGGTPSTTIIDMTPKINVGFCFPETCSAHDIYEIIQNIVEEASAIFPNMTIPNAMKHDSVYCYLRQEDMKFSGAAVVMITISSIFGILILIGTAYDILAIQYRIRIITDRTNDSASGPQAANHDMYETNAINVGGVSPNNRYDNLSETNDEDKPDEVAPVSVSRQPSLRIWEKALVAFSAYSNGRKILDTTQQPGRLNCIDGIRFLSMSWVILGHSYFFAYSYANNLGSFIQILFKRWSYEAIVNATLSVDSFFLLSGLLTAYMFLKEANKMGTINNTKFWILYFVHRYWRLTPPYMLFLGFYTALYKYMSDGPLWSQVNGVDETSCQNNWWTNLLYVNNIVKSKEMCMGWSWYLANDMQFHYFVAPLILPLMFLFGKWSSISASVFVISSLIATGVISRQNSLPAGLPAGTSFDLIYVKPWCRAAPYVVGLMTGYLITEHQKRRWKLHPVIVAVGWIIATATCLAVLYGLTNVTNGTYKLSDDVSALYNSLSRFAWAIGLAWLIYACLTGNGGWINSILSWPALIPLSRLTYCAYLVHPVVMIFYYQTLEFAPVVNTLTVVYWFFGHMIAAYMVAFVLSVTCESPLIGLERILLKKQ